MLKGDSFKLNSGTGSKLPAEPSLNVDVAFGEVFLELVSSYKLIGVNTHHSCGFNKIHTVIDIEGFRGYAPGQT